MTSLTKYIFNFHFNHLKKVKQNYINHMQDSFYYGLTCLKLAICFFIHGFYPDIFDNTSIELSQLLTLIKMKYTNAIKNNGSNSKQSLIFYFNPSCDKLNTYVKND